MSGTVSTRNMAEALYLLHRGNRVVKLQMDCSWPYGLEECSIVFEGQTAQDDHDYYVSHSLPVDLRALPELFAALTAVLAQGGGV
jgi:hypothetical protein